MFRTVIAAAAIAAVFMADARAHDYTVGSLKIGHPWTRATPKGASVGGGYMKITNTGTAPDRLIGGAADVAGRFEVHEMKMENGVMKMRQLGNGLDIAPGQTVELKPGGYHVMFVGLKQPFEQGKSIAATLVFEKAGKVEVSFKIEGIGGQPSGSEHGAHDMKH